MIDIKPFCRWRRKKAHVARITTALTSTAVSCPDARQDFLKIMVQRQRLAEKIVDLGKRHPMARATQ